MKFEEVEIRCPRAKCNSDNIQQLEYDQNVYIPTSYCKCNECGVEFTVWYKPYEIDEAGLGE